MSAILADPIRLDRLQATLADVLTDAMSVIGVPAFWAFGHPSQASLPNGYVVLEAIVPPSPINVRNARGSVLNPTSSINVVVTSAVVGARYSVEINGHSYFTDGIGGDDIDAIAARLIAVINGDLLEPVTAATAGAGTLSLTADFLGALWSLTITGLLSTASQVIDTNNVIITHADNTMLVNIQAFSKNRELYESASRTLNYCYAVLQTPAFSEALTSQGVGIGILGLPVAVPVDEGSRWETRASFDVELTMRSTWVQPGSRIETVDLTTTLQPGDITVQQTITAPTP